jgi:hypothetical protein
MQFGDNDGMAESIWIEPAELMESARLPVSIRVADAGRVVGCGMDGPEITTLL